MNFISKTRLHWPRDEPPKTRGCRSRTDETVGDDPASSPHFNRPRSEVPDDQQRRVALYEAVARPLHVNSNETLLEWGVGGDSAGLVHLAQRYRPAKAIGLVFCPQDLERVQKALSPNIPKALNLSFQLAQSEKTDLPQGCIDKLIGVEGLQYIESWATLFLEFKRILRKKGKFAVAGYFLHEATSPECLVRTYPGLQAPYHHLPVIGPTLDVVKSLGFQHLRYHSLAERVFGHASPLADMHPDARPARDSSRFAPRRLGLLRAVCSSLSDFVV